MDKANAWVEKNSAHKNKMECELLKRAVKTLEENTFRNGTFPWSPYICVSPGMNHFNGGIWNWDSAFHAIAIARWDADLAKDSVLGFFKFQEENGNLPDMIRLNGEVLNVNSKPPVFPWAIKILYDRTKDREFVEEIYPKLLLNEKFWVTNRCHEGLFFYDSASTDEDEYIKTAKYETGWDNSVRWDVDIVDLWPIDLNCYMVDFYRSMSFFAKLLNMQADEKQWNEKEEKLVKKINNILWDEDQKCYVDVNKFTKEKSKVITPASFMPLYIKIASVDRAKHLEIIAKDKFYPLMPTVSYDNPEHSTQYWRGPVWLNVAYFATKGLKDYGFTVADEIKEKILEMCYEEKRGIFENYNSLTGEGLCCDHFSWSAVFLIEFILNF